MLLTGGQVLMKFGLLKAGDFSFSWGYFGRLLINWQFFCCGICFAVGSVLWMYIIKNFPSIERWVGVFLILSGCVLIAK